MSNLTRATALCAVLVLTACGGSSSSDGDGTAPFGDLQVEGTVVFPNGDPAPNIAVRIAGRGPFVTGGDGTFVVNDAPVPYDAIVFEGVAGRAQVWRGLTRPDPVFTVTFPNVGNPNTVDVSGNVSGGIGLPVPMSHETRVSFGFEGGLAFESATPDDITGDYAEPSVSWLGPVITTMHAHALQYEADALGSPVAYSGYGTTSAPIATGDVLLGQNVVMGPVGTSPISGTVTGTGPVNGVAAVLFIEFPGGGFFFLPGQFLLTSSFTLQAPDLPGIESSVFATGSYASGGQVTRFVGDLPLPTTNLDVQLPDATALVLPVDGATGVGHGTEFLVTPNPGDRVYRVSFTPLGGSGGEIVLMTSSSTFRIPDLDAYGLGLVPGAEYEWTVRAIGPATSVDAAAVESEIPIYFQIFGIFGEFSSGTDTWSFFTPP